MNKIEVTNIPLGYYKHYKGTIYLVTGFVRHSEDLSILVVYKKEDEDPWVRPIESFNSYICVDYKRQISIPRFEYLGESWKDII